MPSNVDWWIVGVLSVIGTLLLTIAGNYLQRVIDHLIGRTSTVLGARRRESALKELTFLSELHRNPMAFQHYIRTNMILCATILGFAVLALLMQIPVDQMPPMESVDPKRLEQAKIAFTLFRFGTVAWAGVSAIICLTITRRTINVSRRITYFDEYCDNFAKRYGIMPNVTNLRS